MAAEHPAAQTQMTTVEALREVGLTHDAVGKPSEGAHFARVRAALERGQRDAQLLDGRDYDDHYWRGAKAALTKIGRELDKAAGERDAYRAVIDGAE